MPDVCLRSTGDLRVRSLGVGGLAALLAVLALPGAAVAQGEGEQAQVEEIVVIGSRLPARSATDTAVPVDVIGAEEIGATGARETARAIQAAAPSFNFSSSTISDGTDTLRPATLRGLGPDQTLVLVNGRRRHQGALVHLLETVGRGTAGVDLNAIPVGAIGRVEILRDGASAQYGSDAMAGVINLVLKSDGDGRVHFGYGLHAEGDGATPHLWWHDGWQIGNGGVATLTLDYRDREATHRGGVDGELYYPWVCTGEHTDRLLFSESQAAQVCGDADAYTEFRLGAYTGGDDDRMPGLSPGAVASRFDEDSHERRDNYRIGDGDATHFAAAGNLQVPVAGSWELLAFATYSTREGLHGGYFRKPNQPDRVPSMRPSLPLPDGETPVANPYADGYLPHLNPTTEDVSFSVGAAGQITPDLRADIAYTTGQNVYDYLIVNSINTSYFGVAENGTELVRDSSYTYSDVVTGEEVTLDDIAGPSRGFFEADAGGLTYSQTTLNADFVWLLSDTLGLAFGLERREENYRIRAGEDYSWFDYGGHNPDVPATFHETTNEPKTYKPYISGIQVFPGFRPEAALDEGRDALSLYVEADVTGDAWRAAGALRFEDYSDFGNVVTLKLAGRYGADAWAVRGAVSTGFRAPSLHQLYYSAITTLFPLIDGTITPQQTGTFRNDSRVAQALGIPSLTEETSVNLSLGMVYAPRDLPLHLTLDVYQIDIADRVLLSNALDSRTPDLPQAVETRLEQIDAGAAQVFYNAGDTSTFGLDMVASYKVPLGAMDLDLSLSLNYTDTQVSHVAVPDSLVGLDVQRLFNQRDIDIIENWQPQTRLNLVADLRAQGWSLYAALRQIGEYNASNIQVDSGMFNYYQQTIGGSLLLDASFGYQLGKGLRLTVGGDNILDVYPDTISEPGLLTRAGPLTARGDPNDVIVADGGGIFVYPWGAAPFGFNGAYFYFGLEYSY